MSVERYHQKELSFEFLSKLEIIDPYAIIAGGAPRDWYQDKPARDVDFFAHISGPPPGIDKRLRAIGIKDGLDRAKYGDNIPLDYKLNPDIRCVVPFKLDILECQLIILKTPTFGLVEKFPFNVCQAWVKDGILETTPAFIYGFRNKVLIKMNDLYADSHIYSEKIKSYFPNFKYYSSEKAFLNAIYKAKI